MSKKTTEVDHGTAAHLEPNDGLTFLRFGKLSALASAANAEAMRLHAQVQLLAKQGAEFAAKGDAIMAPLRVKYDLGEGQNAASIDDETFAIKRVKAP